MYVGSLIKHQPVYGLAEKAVNEYIDTGSVLLFEAYLNDDFTVLLERSQGSQRKIDRKIKIAQLQGVDPSKIEEYKNNLDSGNHPKSFFPKTRHKTDIWGNKILPNRFVEPSYEQSHINKLVKIRQRGFNPVIKNAFNTVLKNNNLDQTTKENLVDDLHKLNRAAYSHYRMNNDDPTSNKDEIKQIQHVLVPNLLKRINKVDPNIKIDPKALFDKDNNFAKRQDKLNFLDISQSLSQDRKIYNEKRYEQSQQEKKASRQTRMDNNSQYYQFASKFMNKLNYLNSDEVRRSLSDHDKSAIRHIRSQMTSIFNRKGDLKIEDMKLNYAKMNQYGPMLKTLNKIINTTKGTNNKSDNEDNANSESLSSSESNQDSKIKEVISRSIPGSKIKDTIEDITNQSENKPKSWLAQKIAALRQLYSKWLAKKNQEHDQNKIGFFSNILRLITQGIDFLLKKLQNFAG